MASRAGAQVQPLDAEMHPDGAILSTAPEAGLLRGILPYVNLWPRHDARIEGLSPRGGGCCIDVPVRSADGTATARWSIGVGHYHLPQYRYVQYLYAFRPHPPFEPVAVSRHFCWGGLPHTAATVLKLVPHHRTRYACPYIQMSMGVIQDALHPHLATVAVGANDCTAHLLSVHKADLVAALDPTRQWVFNGTSRTEHARG